MTTRNEAAAAAATAANRTELPTEGTKAWLELVVTARETELAAATAELEAATAAGEHLDAELQQAREALTKAEADLATARKVLGETVDGWQAAQAELAAASDRIAELEESSSGDSDSGGAEHPPAPPLPFPAGDAFVRFTVPRKIPGAVVGPGLAMRNPSYEVLRQSSWVWCTADEYRAHPLGRRLTCTADGTVVEDRDDG